MNLSGSVSRGRKGRQGFTLVEMMVAMLAGSFAIAGVYYLGGVSSRSFNEQMRVSESQMSLRSAMEQLRREVGRAGYLATRSWRELQLAPGASTVVSPAAAMLQALNILPVQAAVMPADVAAVLDPVNNPTRADRLQLVGNYTTADAFLLRPIINLTTMVFDQTTEAFSRAFVDPACGGAAAAQYNAGRFADVFQAQRWVRIETAKGLFFRQVQSVNSAAGSPNITLSAPIGAMDAKGPNWGIIAPVDRIEYSVAVPASEAELTRLMPVAGTEGPGTERAVLVRRELDMVTGVPVANTLRVVLDYAVEFAVDAIVDTSGGVGLPALQLATPGGALDLATVSANNPEQFRAAVITLSTRTPEADPRISRVPRASDQVPFTAFRFPNAVGAPLWSRVRTLRAQIFMPNTVSRR